MADDRYAATDKQYVDRREGRVRMSRCSYQKHAATRVQADGKTYGCNDNGRQKLYGTYPIETPSHPGLPFFKAHPDREFDEHYCGCFGWD